jgi:hypothetical protein
MGACFRSVTHASPRLEARDDTTLKNTVFEDGKRVGEVDKKQAGAPLAASFHRAQQPQVDQAARKHPSHPLVPIPGAIWAVNSEQLSPTITFQFNASRPRQGFIPHRNVNHWHPLERVCYLAFMDRKIPGHALLHRPVVGLALPSAFMSDHAFAVRSCDVHHHFATAVGLLTTLVPALRYPH